MRKTVILTAVIVAIIATSLTVSLPASGQNYNIPSWIKNNAKWWAEGQIGDSDFVQGIQYLIKQNIMKIPETHKTATSSQGIPNWIKNNAKWWSEGQIGDSDFVQGIQYLVQNGIMDVGVTTSVSSTHTPTLTGNYQGTAKWSASFDYYNGNLGSYRENCQYVGNIVLQLQRDGDHVSGNAEVTNYQVVGAIDTSTCQAGFDLSGAVDAIVFGSGFSGTVGVLDIDGQFTTDLLRGQISGNLGDAVDISGQFTASRVN